jgi:hypothetical protein
VNIPLKAFTQECTAMYETVGFALILFAACGAVAVSIWYDLKVK